MVIDSETRPTRSTRRSWSPRPARSRRRPSRGRRKSQRRGRPSSCRHGRRCRSIRYRRWELWIMNYDWWSNCYMGSSFKALLFSIRHLQGPTEQFPHYTPVLPVLLLRGGRDISQGNFIKRGTLGQKVGDIEKQYYQCPTFFAKSGGHWKIVFPMSHVFWVGGHWKSVVESGKPA